MEHGPEDEEVDPLRDRGDVRPLVDVHRGVVRVPLDRVAHAERGVGLRVHDGGLELFVLREQVAVEDGVLDEGRHGLRALRGDVSDEEHGEAALLERVLHDLWLANTDSVRIF